MLWHLIFAHFIADYPLQTTWIVYAKRNFRGLAIHTLIHFLVTIIIAGKTIPIVLPYIAIIALFHFGIDMTKGMVYRYKPQWNSIPYLVDQVLHISVIVLVSHWIDDLGMITSRDLPISRTIAIYGTGYLLVSYVWFISERIFVGKNHLYQIEINKHCWSRMGVRIALLATLLGISNHAIVAFAIYEAIQWPYPASSYRWRAVATDGAVAVTIWLGMILVM